MSDSQTPSTFDSLPAEVRSSIYSYLLPQLHTLIKIEILPSWLLCDCDQLDDSDDDSCKHCSTEATTHHAASANYTAPPHIRDAINLMMVNRMIRQELAPIAYRSICFSAYPVSSLVDLIRNFASPVRCSLRFVGMPMSQYLFPKDTGPLCDVLKDLPSLELVAFSGCGGSGRSGTKGIKWSSYTLIALKAVQEACPQLEYSYWLEDVSNNSRFKIVDLSSKEGLTSRTYDLDLQSSLKANTFNVKAEYENWYFGDTGR